MKLDDTNILKIGVLAGIISAALPSIPTMYWMWKEREEYRWVLILMWIVTGLAVYWVLTES